MLQHHAPAALKPKKAAKIRKWERKITKWRGTAAMPVPEEMPEGEKAFKVWVDEQKKMAVRMFAAKQKKTEKKQFLNAEIKKGTDEYIILQSRLRLQKAMLKDLRRKLGLDEDGKPLSRAERKKDASTKMFFVWRWYIFVRKVCTMPRALFLSEWPNLIKDADFFKLWTTKNGKTGSAGWLKKFLDSKKLVFGVSAGQMRADARKLAEEMAKDERRLAELESLGK